jgi:hypothetical protein
VRLRAVDGNSSIWGGEEVPHHPEREVHLLVQERWRRRASKRSWIWLHRRARTLDVGGQVLLALALGDRADDESARGRAQALDDVAEALSLLVVVDAARETDMAGLRHVDDGAAGNRREGRDARPLGPERLLGDLDEDLLTAPQQLLDRWSGRVHPRLGLRLPDVEIDGILLLLVGLELSALLLPAWPV